MKNLNPKFKYVLLLSILFLPYTVSAAPRAFTQRLSKNITGDIKIIGNTILCPKLQNKKDSACINDISLRNDQTILNKMRTSNATLNTGGNKIVWARLYWQGRSPGMRCNNPSFANKNGLGTCKDSSWSANIPYNASLVPGLTLTLDGSPVALGSVTIDTISNDVNSKWAYTTYSASADITDLSKLHDGIFSVANFYTATGFSYDGQGYFGAWVLAVIYEDNSPDAKFRNIVVYDGYRPVSAQYDNQGNIIPGSTNIPSTGFMNFLTPKAGGVNAELRIFAGEGDKNIPGDQFKIRGEKYNTNFKNIVHTGGSTTNAFDSFITNDFNRTYKVVNNNGIDIQTINVGDSSTNLSTYKYIKNGETGAQVQFSSTGDYYFPSLMIFANDLYAPKLCYDYTYGQNGYYKIAPNTDKPYINDDFDSSKPLDIKLYVRNEENSDITLSNVFMNIKNIDTNQATYMKGSTKVAPAGGILKNVTDSSDTNLANDLNISLGSLGSLQHFYTYFKLKIDSHTGGKIDMPINAYIKYNMSVGGITLGSQERALKELNICQDSSLYLPNPGKFNVVHADQTKGSDPYYYYNLPTQVVKRTDRFFLESMKGAPNYNHSNKATSTTVKAAAVEIIDMDGFHYASATCKDPTVSAMGGRLWEIIDEDTYATELDSKTLLEKKFFDVAISNSAFRILSNILPDGNGSILFEKLGNNSYKPINLPVSYEKKQCHVGFTPPASGGSMQISSYCGSNLSTKEVKTCMKCIYGYNTETDCSRDNFAIRPEAYSISLIDKKESNSTTTKKRIASNTPAPTITNLAAGYDYTIEVNATDHKNSSLPTPGYDANDVNSTLTWNPTATVSKIKCNDTDNNESAISFSDGLSKASRHLNQVGRYTLKYTDSSWTKVDHIPKYMAHHKSPYFRVPEKYTDCIVNDDSVWSSSSKKRNGCKISSKHTNIEFTKEFTNMNFMFYPYTFDLNLTIGARPTNDNNNNTFVYINTLANALYPNGQNENMSYNIQGTFTAVGKNGITTTNFVDGCYAQSVDMNLSAYYPTPALKPADDNTVLMRADVIDHSTVTAGTLTVGDVIRARAQPNLALTNTDKLTSITQAVPTRFIVRQASQYFKKEMNASINMDLGFNFGRQNNLPLNPRQVTMKDFNISYTTPPPSIWVDMSNTHKIVGTLKLDQNVTFMYAKANPAQLHYQTENNNVDTPVSVVVYCDSIVLGYAGCQQRGIDIVHGQTNDRYWWKSTAHNNVLENDGNIELVSAPVGLVNPIAVPIIAAGENANVNVARGVNPPPLTVPVRLVTPAAPPVASPAAYTDRWLISNSESGAASATDAKNLNGPNPFYDVNFPSVSGWAGTGNTGNVVGQNSSALKNKRLEQ